MDSSPVTRSSDIMSGTAVFAGTRVPVQTLIDYLNAGDRLEEFLDDFPTVTRDAVVAVLGLVTDTDADSARPAR